MRHTHELGAQALDVGALCLAQRSNWLWHGQELEGLASQKAMLKAGRTRQLSRPPALSALLPLLLEGLSGENKTKRPNIQMGSRRGKPFTICR